MEIPRQFALLLGLWALVLSALNGYDIPGYVPDQIIEYKQTVDSSGGVVGLDLHIFTPDGHQASDQRPAIVFFFGGGWVSGSASQFHPHCEYLASRGMVAISAEYRVKNLHGTTPQECVKDGKSAVRWIRQNAGTLGIDPDRIAAGGGSAGGQVAAATGTLAGYDEPGEDLAVSSKPNALVLYNPVFDNGPGPTGWGYSTVQDYWENFSPRHNIGPDAPPTTVFLGTSDALIPVAAAEGYQAAMETEGLRCDLHLYEGQPHSFFNFDVPDDSSGPFYGFRDTLFKTDEFLVSLGYLSAPRDQPIPVAGWVAIFGDAGFSGSSAATASPVTTDGDADSIAANMDPITLADGEFVRLTGTVTFDAPLTGGSFRIGLFDAEEPVAAGDGSGYVGVWAEAPATSDSNLAAGDGSGSSHPFETPHATILGPVPAAGTTVPAGTPVDFALMVARNGNALDISATFTANGTYHQAQTLLNQAVANHTFDRVAFLMSVDLNATQGNFSNVAVESGQVLPGSVVPVDPETAPIGVITFVDAVEGSSGNTFASGGSPGSTTWIGTGSDQWLIRTGFSEANGGEFYQSSNTGGVDPVELTTQITGLADGTYDIFAFYWDQIDSDNNNWIISAGLSSGSLTSYSSPGEPSVGGSTQAGVTYAGDLNFTTSVAVDGYNDGNPTLLRQLFGVNLGQATVAGGSAIHIYVDNLINGGSGQDNRTWYDGVGYARVNNYDNWISGFDVGLLTIFTEDPDGDGIQNGLENFFGTDPSAENAEGLSPITRTGNTFVFTHPHATPANDIMATYQWSTDLNEFFDDGISDAADLSTSFVALTDTPTPGVTTVTATISGTSMPSALFVRLKLTQVGL